MRAGFTRWDHRTQLPGPSSDDQKRSAARCCVDPARGERRAGHRVGAMCDVSSGARVARGSTTRRRASSRHRRPAGRAIHAVRRRRVPCGPLTATPIPLRPLASSPLSPTGVHWHCQCTACFRIQDMPGNRRGNWSRCATATAGALDRSTLGEPLPRLAPKGPADGPSLHAVCRASAGTDVAARCVKFLLYTGIRFATVDAHDATIFADTRGCLRFSLVDGGT